MTTDLIDFTEDNSKFLSALVQKHLDKHGLTAASFAAVLGVYPDRVYDVIQARSVTQSTVKPFVDYLLRVSPPCQKKYPMPLERQSAGGYK